VAVPGLPSQLGGLPGMPSFPGYSFPAPGSPVFSYVAATLILGIALTVGWLWKLPSVTQIAQSPSPEDGSVATSSDAVVAKITGQVECRWAKPVDLSSDNVPLGRKYALSAGLLEITYNTGVRVILQGPANYQVTSRNGGTLSVGKLTARLHDKRMRDGGQRSEESSTAATAVPSSPLSPVPVRQTPAATFAIRTPTTVVTDLGTEFGVDVNSAGRTEVHVLEGVVEAAYLPTAKDASPKPIRLEQGNAMQFAASTARHEFVRVPYRQDQFVRSLQSAGRNDEFSAPVLNPMWFWDNPAFGKFSLSESPGQLRITLGGCLEMIHADNARRAPFLRTDASKYGASFRIETRVDFSKANKGVEPVGLSAGLLVYDSANDDAKYACDLTYELWTTGPDPHTNVVVLGTPKVHLGAIGLPWDDGVACLRLDRDGTKRTWTAYYRQSEADPWIRWITIGDDKLPGGGIGKMECGLVAQARNCVLFSPAVDFDYYRVTPATDAAAKPKNP
jgi:hypothetical protein